MATPPLSPRKSALDERLRLLDDAFIPTLTPTNTWLSNVRQPDDNGEEDSYDDTTPTEEDYTDQARRNRFEDPPRSTGSTSKSERKMSLTSTTSSEPRSSSLPPAIQPKAKTPSPPNSGAAPHHVAARGATSRSEAGYLLEVDSSLRRAATDP